MCDHRTPSATAVQRAVLGVALDAHPDPVAIPDIAVEIGQRAVERAISKLCEVGLLDRDGDSLMASAAAVHFDRLGL
ncbi:MAG TPA: hypothetical protein VEQ41_00545 [Solirubrobacterales bacterium]|nr:hypothetical protein [Solirubrobacterales bacterium]